MSETSSNWGKWIIVSLPCVLSMGREKMTIVQKAMQISGVLKWMPFGGGSLSLNWPKQPTGTKRWAPYLGEATKIYIIFEKYQNTTELKRSINFTIPIQSSLSFAVCMHITKIILHNACFYSPFVGKILHCFSQQKQCLAEKSSLP